ncbi:hypothetical protein AAVH_20177 [Aphelenchoides avenae]|nr:hypothetical protein AAVH_20177 [Aphelenchus avenae]
MTKTTQRMTMTTTMILASGTKVHVPFPNPPLDWVPVVPNDGDLTEICAYWPKGKKVKKRTCKKSLKKIKATLKRMAPTSAAP